MIEPNHTMSYVHVFVGMDESINTARLGSYLQPTYNDAGERVNSTFLNEVGIADYEPQAIESLVLDGTGPLRQILDGTSYFTLWQAGLPEMTARYFILLFDRNVITRADTTLVQYLGRFDFAIPKTSNPWD